MKGWKIKAVSWDEAIGQVCGSKLLAIKNGAKAITDNGSSRGPVSNEANFVAQKFARAVIRK